MYVCELPKSKVNALSILMHIVPLLCKSNLRWIPTTPMFDYLRAFTMVMLKNLAFSNSKNYFIYFKTLLYNTLNIKCSIFLPLHLNILFLLFLYSSSMSLSLYSSPCLSLLWSKNKWTTNKPTPLSSQPIQLTPTPTNSHHRYHHCHPQLPQIGTHNRHNSQRTQPIKTHCHVKLNPTTNAQQSTTKPTNNNN